MINYPVTINSATGISPVARLVRARDLRVGDRLKYFKGVATFVITEICREGSAGRLFYVLKHEYGTARVSDFAWLHVQASIANATCQQCLSTQGDN